MIPFIITIFIDFLVGIIAFANRRNPAARVLALFIICFGLWQTELYILKTVDNLALLNRSFHLTRIGMFFLPFFLTKLTWQICGASSSSFNTRVLWPLLVCATALGVANNTYYPSILVKSASGYLPKPDIVYYAFLLTLFYALLASFTLAIVLYKHTAVREKRRLKWLLITLILAVLVAAFPVSVFILSPDTYLLSVVSAIGNIVFLGVLLYSIVNYHLTDIGTAFGNLLAHFFVLGLVTGLFFLGQEMIDQSGNQQSATTLGPSLLKGLLLSVLVSFYPGLLSFAKPSAKKLIVKQPLNYKIVKRQLNLLLKRCLNNDDLVTVMDDVIHDTLRLGHYHVFVAVHPTAMGSELVLRSLADTGASTTLSRQALATLKLQSQSTVLMLDEISVELSALMTKFQSTGLCPLWLEEHFIGLLCVGSSPTNRNSYYRYDEIRIFELIISELPATLLIITQFSDTQLKLENANKTLSIVELMTQYQHEIKAPLSIIDGVLSNDVYDKETQRDIILEQVSRGTNLINMMNGVLREKYHPKRESIHIMALIQRCTLLFKPQFKSISCDTAPSLPMIMGDKDELSIMFINVFKNAAEAKSPKTSLTLTITASHHDGLVWISITDTGLGMNKKQLAELWTRKNETTKAMGSGIGLGVVRRIAKQHGGKIEVDSQSGLGTTFRFGFPAILAQNRKPIKPQEKLSI